MDWPGEWAASAVWIGEVFAATILGLLVFGWLLTRLTAWGRQFRVVGLPFFRPGSTPASWAPLAIMMVVLLMTVAAVRLNVLLSYSLNGLYTALQKLDSAGFAWFLGIFGALATLHVIRVMLDYLITQALVIRWRVWLNRRLVDDWLAGTAYHRTQFVKEPVDNPDQRIQVDVDSFTSESANLGVGTINALLSLGSFSLILWQLSGPLPVGNFMIPRAMVFISFAYVLLASVLAFRIGRPLIGLSFQNEQLNGSFRYSLVRLRENSEPIAFHGGEEVERAVLGSQFTAVISNAWRLVFRSLKFQGFNLVISQASVVIPLIIQAPRFFSKAITLGDITQTASSFGQVHDSLSFFRNAYDTFAGYRAVLERLTGMINTNRRARSLPALAAEDGAGLVVRELTVRRPDAKVLIDRLSIDLAPGDALLVKGPSGSGKTTLLRALAELWPYAAGSVRRPQGPAALFLSQEPYLPLGTIRAAMAYPLDPSAVDDLLGWEVLNRVHLEHLADRLDVVGDWTRRLSPGEQQRLGFARVLVNRPQVVFLDEATSAVDEDLEQRLYQMLRAELPDTVVVSIGHRSTLAAFHSYQIELVGGGSWVTHVAPAGPARPAGQTWPAGPTGPVRSVQPVPLIHAVPPVPSQVPAGTPMAGVTLFAVEAPLGQRPR